MGKILSYIVGNRQGERKMNLFLPTSIMLCVKKFFIFMSVVIKLQGNLGSLILSTLLFALILCNNVYADGELGQPSTGQQAVHIVDRNLDEKKDTLAITGRIPQINFVQFDQIVEETINSKIRENYNQRVAIAISMQATKIYFDYRIIHDGDYLSLIVSAEIKGIEQHKFFDIVNIDTTSKEMIFINDKLGPNGVKIVNMLIEKEIASNPSRFIPEFSGITNEHSFYVENNRLILIFNRDEIIFGQDFYSMAISMNNVTNLTMPDSMYKILESSYNLKMIPLRPVLEAFGFEMEWFGNTQTVEIKRGEFFYSSIRINENLYFRNTSPKRLLESAPVLINGRTYLPISFFEEFLLLFYSIDNDGTITFSEYN